MVSEKFNVELKAPDIEPYRKSNIGVEFVTTFDSGKSGPHVMSNDVTLAFVRGKKLDLSNHQIDLFEKYKKRHKELSK